MIFHPMQVRQYQSAQSSSPNASSEASLPTTNSLNYELVRSCGGGWLEATERGPARWLKKQGKILATLELLVLTSKLIEWKKLPFIILWMIDVLLMKNKDMEMEDKMMIVFTSNSYATALCC